MSWEAFLGALLPSCVAVLVAIASYYKARAEAIKNTKHLEQQDAQLTKIAHQVSDECVVMKAKDAALRVLQAATVAADKVTREAQVAATKLKETAQQITSVASDLKKDQ